MANTAESGGGLDHRRKRLLFRCWHRGTREMDLILGRFADAHIATLGDDEVAVLEQLLDMPDPELFSIASGVLAPPPFAAELFARIKAFNVAEPGL
jgi:antitoxin CptB